MTTFKSALGLCGLSQQEAAAFFGVSIQSIKDWSRGRSAPPIGVWQMMADLHMRIEDAAYSAAEMIEPGVMDRRSMNSVTSDAGVNLFPGSGDAVAGAIALLLAMQDEENG